MTVTKICIVSSNTSEAVAGIPEGVFFGANDTSFPPNPKVTPTGVFNHLGAFLRAASQAYIKSESQQLLCNHTKLIHRTTLRCRRIQLLLLMYFAVPFHDANYLQQQFKNCNHLKFITNILYSPTCGVVISPNRCTKIRII